MRHRGSGRLAQALGLNMANREARPTALIVFVVCAGAAIAALATFRVPRGPFRDVSGTAESVGFDPKGSLSATIRLDDGRLVWLRVPRGTVLSQGYTVTLHEQPLYFGSPTFAFAGVRAREP